MKRRNFLTGAVAAGFFAGRPGMAADLSALKALPIGAGDLKTAGKLAEMGYGYVEIGVGEWLNPAADDAAFALKLAEMKAGALPVKAMNGFLPKDGYRISGPDANHDKIVGWGKIAFARARQAGVEVITVGSGGARKIPEGFEHRKAQEQFAALIGRLANAANDEGVVMTIENLNRGETNLGNTLEECLMLVQESGSPHAMLTHDIYHSLRENEGPEIVEKAGARIVHCHVAEKETRSQPGFAGDDFRPYLAALAKIGYHGRFTFECGWKGGGGIEAGARAAIDAFRGQMG